MELVDTKRTGATAHQAARELALAFKEVSGEWPAATQLALVLAQSSLETGRWGKMFGWNWGNLKALEGYAGKAQRLKGATEIVDGKEVPNVHLFRAYDTPAAGARDYLALLYSRREWWAGVLSGSPELFVESLARPPAYFTASERRYLSALRPLYDDYLLVLEGQAPEGPQKKRPGPAEPDAPNPYSAYWSSLPSFDTLPNEGDGTRLQYATNQLLEHIAVAPALRVDGIVGPKTRGAVTLCVLALQSAILRFR